MQDLDHRHILVTAHGLATPPRTAAAVETWLRELVDLVGMKVLFGPHATRCETDGNEGCTGVVCIETSHASIHVWDTGCVPFAKMDLYSCKHFETQVVLDHFKQFGPEAIDFMVIDRNAGLDDHVRLPAVIEVRRRSPLMGKKAQPITTPKFRTSVCEWSLSAAFLTKQQCCDFVTRHLASTHPLHVTYREERVELGARHVLEVHGRGGQALQQVAALLSDLDHQDDD